MRNYIMKFYNRLLQLIKYNWSKVIKEFVPKDNKLTINNTEILEMKDGLILYVVAVTLLYIFKAFLDVVVYYRIHSALGEFSYIFNIAFKEAFVVNIPSIIMNITFAVIVPIVFLWFIETYKNNKQNTWVYFITAIISAIGVVGTVLEIIGEFSTLFICPILTILCMASNVAITFAFISILKGSLDFSHRGYLEFNQNKKEEVKKEA